MAAWREPLEYGFQLSIRIKTDSKAIGEVLVFAPNGGKRRQLVSVREYTSRFAHLYTITK